METFSVGRRFNLMDKRYLYNDALVMSIHPFSLFSPFTTVFAHLQWHFFVYLKRKDVRREEIYKIS